MRSAPVIVFDPVARGRSRDGLDGVRAVKYHHASLFGVVAYAVLQVSCENGNFVRIVHGLRQRCSDE